MNDLDLSGIYYVARKLRSRVDEILFDQLPHLALPAYHYVVLRDIVETPGTSVQEISRRLSMAQSMVSKAVAGLREKKLIVCLPDSDDERRQLLTPSSDVQKLLKPLLSRPAEEVINNILPSSSQADKLQAMATIELLYRAFKAQEEKKRNAKAT